MAGTVDCLRMDRDCAEAKRPEGHLDEILLLWKMQQTRSRVQTRSYFTGKEGSVAFFSFVQAYLPERRVLCLAGRARGRVVGVVEGLVAGVHGDLILPVEAMVPQLRHPLIKQLLRFNLQRQSEIRTRTRSKRGQSEDARCTQLRTHAPAFQVI